MAGLAGDSIRHAQRSDEACEGEDGEGQALPEGAALGALVVRHGRTSVGVGDELEFATAELLEAATEGSVNDLSHHLPVCGVVT